MMTVSASIVDWDFQKLVVFHDSGYKFNQWFDMVWMEKMIGEHNAEPKEVWG